MRHPSQTSSRTLVTEQTPTSPGPDRLAQAPCSTIYSLAATTSPVRTAEPRGRPAPRRPRSEAERDTLDPSNPRRGEPACGQQKLDTYPRSATEGIAAAEKTAPMLSVNQPQHLPTILMLQRAATTTTQHAPINDRSSPRNRASGGRAWPGRSRPGPLSASGPRGHPERVPPCRSGGPLPDLPPAVLGMTRPAQVGAYTGGTPAFIPRPATGLPVAKSSYLWTYPLSLPRPVRKSSLPLLPSTTGTLPPGCRQLQPSVFHHHPPNGKSRTGRLLLLRKTQVAVAVAACGLLTSLRPEFCSAASGARRPTS